MPGDGAAFCGADGVCSVGGGAAGAAVDSVGTNAGAGGGSGVGSAATLLTALSSSFPSSGGAAVGKGAEADASGRSDDDEASSSKPSVLYPLAALVAVSSSFPSLLIPEKRKRERDGDGARGLRSLSEPTATASLLDDRYYTASALPGTFYKVRLPYVAHWHWQWHCHWHASASSFPWLAIPRAPARYAERRRD